MLKGKAQAKYDSLNSSYDSQKKRQRVFMHNSIQVVRTEHVRELQPCCEMPVKQLETVPYFNPHTFNERSGLSSRQPPSFYHQYNKKNPKQLVHT